VEVGKLHFDHHVRLVGLYGAFRAAKEAYEAGQLSREDALVHLDVLLHQIDYQKPSGAPAVYNDKNTPPPQVKRKPLDFATRYAAMRKSEGLCPYCGVELQFEHDDGERVAFDHVIPLSRGGADDISNIIACCFPCNAAKHTKTGLEYLCEVEGLSVHWFARFNPELDGYSAEDTYEDLLDRDAWFGSWREIAAGTDYCDDHAYEVEL
jgi:hypothetical protein